MNTLRNWVHGLIAAFIGGGAVSITVMVIDPFKFNFGDGLANLGKVFVVAGVLKAAAYLAQSPLPAPPEPQLKPKS